MLTVWIHSCQFIVLRRSFVRVSRGPEVGAYHHEYFLRDKPHLAVQMVCKNTRSMFAMALEEKKEQTNCHVKPTGPSSSSVSPTTADVSCCNSHATTETIVSDQSESDSQWPELASEAKVAPKAFAPLFGAGTNLELLQHQVELLQRQAQVNRMQILEHAMLMQQQSQPLPFLQDDQVLQRIHQLLQWGRCHREGQSPSNQRAHAA
jgi:hypothetical protein